MTTRPKLSIPAQHTDAEPSTVRRSRRRVLGWTAGGGAALAAALLAKSTGTQEAQAQTPPGFVGSWIVTFPPGNNQMDDPNERDLVSFTSDGVMFSSNSPSSPPDPTQGPDATRTYTTAGQGAWVATGAGKIRFKFVSVDTDDQSKFMDLSQITGTLTLGADGNSFSGSFQVQVTDATGAVLFDSQGDAGTVVGTRIVA